MNRLKIDNFNFQATLLGGQSFSWDYNGTEYKGVTSERYIVLKPVAENEVLWQTYPFKDDLEYLKRYLRLDVDYEGILEKFPRDEFIDKARVKFKGLRLLAQEFPDTLLGYLCATNKSIKAIRVCIRRFCELYGEKIDVKGEMISLIPNLERLSALSVDDITKTGAGFRSKYILEASKAYMRGLFNGIEMDSYEEAKRKLISLKGVGDKVADCILLYSLSHDSIIPMDVWVKRVLNRYYGIDNRIKYEQAQDWVSKYFNGVGGWAGQMLFEDIRGFDSI